MVAISSKRDFFWKLLAFIFGPLSGLILALTFALILAEMKFEPDFKGEAVDCWRIRSVEVGNVGCGCCEASLRNDLLNMVENVAKEVEELGRKTSQETDLKLK